MAIRGLTQNSQTASTQQKRIRDNKYLHYACSQALKSGGSESRARMLWKEVPDSKASHRTRVWVQVRRSVLREIAR
jgi:hypothetical protein